MDLSCLGSFDGDFYGGDPGFVVFLAYMLVQLLTLSVVRMFNRGQTTKFNALSIFVWRDDEKKSRGCMGFFLYFAPPNSRGLHFVLPRTTLSEVLSAPVNSLTGAVRGRTKCKPREKGSGHFF